MSGKAVFGYNQFYPESCLPLASLKENLKLSKQSTPLLATPEAKLFFAGYCLVSMVIGVVIGAVSEHSFITKGWQDLADQWETEAHRWETLYDLQSDTVKKMNSVLLPALSRSAKQS